jgi:hypothetical protein
METVWTIDARSFDYLGIISRDLGKEISVLGFIESIGVDFGGGMPTTPLVVDAGMHAPWLLSRFSPDNVSMDFSRQYTRIKWKPRRRDELEFSSKYIRDLDETEQQLYSEFVRERVGHDTYVDVRYEGSRWVNQMMRGVKSVRLANFDNDIAGLVAIKMRWLTVLNSTKELGRVWERINGAMSKSYHDGNRGDTYLLYLALICACAYCLRGGVPERAPHGPQPARPALASWWAKNQRGISTVLVGRGFEEMPRSLDEIQLKDDELVDTKTYWRDWEVWGGEIQY